MKNDSFQPEKPIDLEKLLDYVEGTASEDTRQQVDQYLAHHEEERQVIEGIRIYYEKYGMNRDALLNFLKDSRNETLDEIKTSETKTRTFPQWARWVAAIVVFALGAIIYLWSSQNKLNQDLSAYFAEPYPATMFLSEQKTNNWVEAYQNEDFQKSAAQLETLLRENPDNKAILQFYAGLSYLYENPPKPALAISNLSQVKDSVVDPQATWFLALAYLQNNQPEKARPLLQNIVDHQSYRHEDASALLERIPED